MVGPTAGWRIAARRAARSGRRGAPASPTFTWSTQDGGPNDLPQRLEVDADRDGLAERIFEYEQGQLAVEHRDTNGDGQYDRVDFFDLAGRVVRSDEDLDRDGAIDVSTYYRAGRIVRREILNPDVVLARRP